MTVFPSHVFAIVVGGTSQSWQWNCILNKAYHREHLTAYVWNTLSPMVPSWGYTLKQLLHRGECLCQRFLMLHDLGSSSGIGWCNMLDATYVAGLSFYLLYRKLGPYAACLAVQKIMQDEYKDSRVSCRPTLHNCKSCLEKKVKAALASETAWSQQ